MASSILTRWKIEAKVAAATAASAAVGIVGAVLNDVENDHALLGGLPLWLQTIILVAVPPLASFAAGYQAKHTSRDGQLGIKSPSSVMRDQVGKPIAPAPSSQPPANPSTGQGPASTTGS